MKTLRNILLIAIFIAATSCEILDTEGNLSVAERLEGSWKADDDYLLKSTDNVYYPYIDKSPIDSNTIEIDNFHELGRGISVEASISGFNISLPQQTVGNGWTVRGSATISSNYKQLTWTYFVDDGSGIWDEENVLYTKGDY